MLAAVGVGVIAPDQLHTWLRSHEREQRIDPDPEAHTVHDQRYPHFLGLYGDLKDRFADLAESQ